MLGLTGPSEQKSFTYNAGSAGSIAMFPRQGIPEPGGYCSADGAFGEVDRYDIAVGAADRTLAREHISRRINREARRRRLDRSEQRAQAGNAARSTELVDLTRRP